LEASAKTGDNVDEASHQLRPHMKVTELQIQAFDQAARDILKKIRQGVFDDKTVSFSRHADGFPIIGVFLTSFASRTG